MTKFSTKLLTLLIFALASTSLMAQINDLSPYPIDFVVKAPSNIAGSYPYGTQVSTDGEWGPQLNYTVQGDVAWGFTAAGDSLGCEPIVTDLTGKMAIIRRGVCNFSLKVYNAQAAGAVGCIILNHYDDPANDAETVVGMLGGDSLTAVTIPAVFASRATGEKIVSEVDAGSTVNAAFELKNMYDQVGPYSYHTPLDQVIALDQISVNIFNSSDTDVQDVTAKVEIEDPAGGMAAFTLNKMVDPQADSLFVFEDAYTPTMTGTYTMTFSNDYSSDTLVQNFIVTDYTFGVDDGEIDGSLSAGDQGFIDDGRRYDMGSSYIAGANGGTATHMTFALANPADLYTGDQVADLFSLVVYDMDPNNTGVISGQADSYDDFQVVGFGGYSLTGNEQPNELITVEFFDPIVLEANKAYLAVVSYDGNAANINIAPRYTSAGATNYPFFGSTVFTDRLYMGGWVSNNNAIIRMHMQGFMTDVRDLPLLGEDQVTLFPNPASTDINLELALENASDVQVYISDFDGKLVRQDQLDNVKEGVFNYNVNDLANGTYFMTVKSQEGWRTKKFVVVH
ncbi:MAG: T9SS type A sorting domain-containing protein [Saprospiraceae bacterium]|nr:T9SS type A sorting domain-containing protein [Saprospiraceae bacterium]